MQEPQLLTPKQLIERATQNRIGNPRRAEQDYLRAAAGKSVPAFFQLITDYTTGFYDGVKDEKRADELITDLATLLQNNYQELLITDATLIAELNKDVAHFLQNYAERLGKESGLLNKLKDINNHLYALNLLNSKQDEAALKCFESMAVNRPWCRVELAKAALNGRRGDTVDLEQALTESVLVLEHYIGLTNNNENFDRHIVLATLESVRILYDLSNSLNSSINDKAKKYLSHFATKKGVASILNTYVNHHDANLSAAAREIIIRYLNPDPTKEYAQALVIGVSIFAPSVNSKDAPEDIVSLYKPFKDFHEVGTLVPIEAHHDNLTRLLAINNSKSRRFFACKTAAMIQEKDYVYECDNRLSHDQKATPNCFNSYLEAYEIYQDDIEVILALGKSYRTKINAGESQYVIPYISLLSQGLINCHNAQCLQYLQNILNSYDWQTRSYKILTEFYIGFYYLKNNRHSQAFIIFHNIINQHTRRKIDSSVAEVLFQDLMQLRNEAVQKNELNLAKQLLELAVAFQPQHGLILLFEFYVRGSTGIPEDIYRDDLTNQIAASIWQQSKEQHSVEHLKYTKELLLEFKEYHGKHSEQITSRWTGILALEAGLEKEKNACRPLSENSVMDYHAAMKEFETAHGNKIMLGTLRLAIAYELNYQGSGASVAEAINLYKIFLTYPLIKQNLAYLPAIAECLERLIELSSHPRPDIHKFAREVLLANASLCSDEQIKKLLQQFSNPAVRLVCFEQLLLRQDLLRNMPIDIILELASFDSPKYKQAAQATLLASSEQCFDAVLKIAETPNHAYVAQANNIVGLMARSGKVATIYKIQPWRNDSLIMLRYFLLALRGGCADALLNVLPVIEALLKNPRTIADANRDLLTILKIALEKVFLDKFDETEKPLLIALVALLKLHKDVSKPAMYLLDQIIEKIGLSGARRKLEVSEEVDVDDRITANPQLTRSGSPLYVSSPGSEQKNAEIASQTKGFQSP